MNSRKFSKPIKKIVIKIGSSLIANYRMKPRKAHLRQLVEQVVELRKRGIQVVLVSSGAIVLGMGELQCKSRPSDLASLQALAAIGQMILMRTYSDILKKSKVACAQLLLTWEDFDARVRYNNARNTLNALLEKGVLPIVNENDTISTEEIKFGDNDKLSAFVATLVQADLLVILSDVEGLYDLKGKEKKVFDAIKEITEEIEGLAHGTAKKQFSKGGMKAKLDAIKIAVYAKVPCIVANGEMDNVVLKILQGESIGTLFMEKEERLLARKHWISFGVRPKGTIIVDDGAKAALLKGGKSLLLPGVVKSVGHFKKEDVVCICDQHHQEIARGIVKYSYLDLMQITDKKGQKEVIHCNDMVLNER